MNGALVHYEGPRNIVDSNVDLWQQYLAALNKPNPSAYSPSTATAPNTPARPGDSVKKTTSYETTNTALGAGLGEDNEHIAETSPSPNTHEDTQSDEEYEDEEDDEYDIIINFDNNDEDNGIPEEESSVSSRRVENTHCQSTNSPYMNGSCNQHITSNSESKDDQTASESSSLSPIESRGYLDDLKSIQASLGSDHDKQLAPALLLDSTGPPEVQKPESDSEASDEVTYHPHRFNMARRSKKKNKNLAVAKIPSKEVQTISKSHFPVAPAERKEELKELQQNMITRAGNRALGIPEEGTVVTNEALALARQGDGTDPNSEVAKNIRSFVTDIPATKMIGYHDTPSTQLSNMIRNECLDQHMKTLGGGRLRYHEGATFNNDPDPLAIVERVFGGTARTSDGHALDGGAKVIDENGQPTNWKKSFGNPNEDWLRPDMLYQRDPGYLPLFQKWLKTSSISLPEAIITNRLSFYDGTAHSDGITSMYIETFEEPTSFLDFSDKRNIDHSHETSTGFIFNATTRKAEEALAEEESRRLSELEYRSMMVLKPENNPNVPRANIYLRPVENSDINELTALYNWYVNNTFRTLERLDISEQDMVDRKNECRRESMPFMVAIERRIDARNRFTEAVVGYASAADFTGSGTASLHTAELEIFVHHKRRGLGIANCLIDKLLSVCDRTYVMRQGYFFESTPAGRAAYSPGGNRQLARLIFIVHFQDSDNSEYYWVRDWLESRFMFEEQGLLRGVAYKRNRVMNSSYLVRNTGVPLADITPNGRLLGPP